MKLLYCAHYHDYGCIDRGPSFDEINLGDSLRHMRNIEVVDFHYDIIRHQGADVNVELLSTIKKERPDITLVVLFKDDFDVQALDRARKSTTLVSWGSDDHVDFDTGYMPRYAPHFDCCVTTYKPSVPWYVAVGQPNVIVSQWGCNLHFYHPSDKGYLYDVSFVGLNYGLRLQLLNHLWKRGIRVAVFGRNWSKTRLEWRRGSEFTLLGRRWMKPRWLSPAEMVKVYGRSKINLCINNNIIGVENIKGRNFEVPGCRGFLLSGLAQNLEEYFEIGKEVVVYKDPDDLVEKIQYYLEHEDERKGIAQAGYERVLRDHTYEKRFEQIFSIIKQAQRKEFGAGHVCKGAEQSLTITKLGCSNGSHHSEAVASAPQVIRTATDPFISIVVPCYNHAHFLGDCLQSVMEQTVQNWEVIVVDDASSQGNPESIVSGFRDARMRYVRHDRNLGLAAARNSGFRLAQAQLVLPLDTDDKLASTYLRKMSLALQVRPDADCVYPDFQLFGLRRDVWHYQVCDAATMTRRQWIPGPGTLMRRSLWARVGGYCEVPELRSGNTDWDFWLAAVAVGVRAIHVPEALYLYRRQESSMSTRGKYFDFQTHEFMYQRHRTLFDRYGTGKEFRAEGYQNSAVAAWHRGERLRAACLTAKAWRLSRRRLHLLKLMAITLTPPLLLPVERKGWGLLRRIGRV